MALYLKEHLTFDRAEMVVESVKEGNSELKTLYMQGIFIQGGVRNANERVYPVNEIENAVDTLNNQIKEGRGSGNVNDLDGKVSDFEIITVDIVAQPSAPNAYPKAIYEGLMNMKHGHKVLEVAREARGNKQVERYLKDEVMRLIRDLKID
jgi:hypothetical protein